MVSLDTLEIKRSKKGGKKKIPSIPTKYTFVTIKRAFKQQETETHSWFL